MNEFPTYTIRTVGDFLSVPADRRDECVRQFRKWLFLISNLRVLFTGIEGITAESAEFVWIDDGKEDMKVNAQIVPEEVQP